MTIFCPVGVWEAPVKNSKFKGVIENKQCSPEKVSIICYLQIDTLPTQKLMQNYHELSCSILERQKLVFCQMQY
jgi:hypothetical protein